MTKFIKVIFSISCWLALVKSMNDMGSLSFKCIFDPDKTISAIVPDLLVIQQEYEYENNCGRKLQTVDCFINVVRNSIIDSNIEKRSQELETRDLTLAGVSLNEIEYSEYVEKQKANEIDSVVGKGFQNPKLKRKINTKDGAEIKIHYRSIAQDKQFKTRKFKKVTKIVSSKKTTAIIQNDEETIKGLLNLRNRTVYQRSIDEDKIFKTKKYTKITKRLKSKSSNEDVALVKNSEYKVDSLVEPFCNSKSVDCYSTSFVKDKYGQETNNDIATNKDVSSKALESVYKTPNEEVYEEQEPNDNAISTIDSLKSDYNKLDAELFEGHNPDDVMNSIENNMLDSINSISSETQATSNEIRNQQPKNFLFNDINHDNFLENILHHPRFLYA